MTSKPSFYNASVAFDTIYGNGTLAHVAELIGGKVKQNIDGGYFENACAIRMSYVLNRNGIPVSGTTGSTVSGKDQQRYLYRLRDTASFCGVLGALLILS